MPKEIVEKTKNFVRSKLGEATMLVVMAGLSVLLTLIAYSTELLISGNGSTLWDVSKILGYTYILKDVNIYFIVAFLVKLALAIVAAVFSFVKGKKIPYCVYAGFSFALDIVLMIFQLILAVFNGLAVVCIILDMLLMAAMMAILLVKIKREKRALAKEQEPTAEYSPEREEQDVASLPKRIKMWRIVMLVCECVATFAMFLMLFLPIYSVGGSTLMYSLIQSLIKPGLPIYFKIAFLAVFVGCIMGLLSFISIFSFVKTKQYYKKSKSYVYVVTMFTLAFFVAGYTMTFILNVSQTTVSSNGALISFVPFVLAIAAMLVHSLALGRCAADIETGDVIKSTSLKVEPLICVALMTVALFSTLLLNVVTIKASVGSLGLKDTSLNGLDLLTKYAELGGGFQLVSFLLYAILLTSAVMLLISLFAFVSKSKDYYRIVKTSAFTNLAFSLLIGLFGVYFRVAQQINIDNINSLLEMFGLSGFMEYSYELTSQTMIVLVACGVIFAIMLFRKQFNLAVEQTEMEVSLKNPKDARALAAATSASQGGALGQSNEMLIDFDACPAFTELDGKLPELNAELQKKRQHLFENFTLPNLVRFVVDYARESRLHLSYSLEDMATFVAGLGASRLTILQGMSGTGKTSLPKIFTEAVMGVCEIVEVESSWRDKNELLGYYNEFSKCFTPKKFTQCLYKARLNSSVLTLIVLDEMNLSRIEYYFSDFLSLMEHEPDKREIKLLNIKLCRTEDGEQIPYKGLTDGHTIKMPQNVWFIGTANRDESTFAISDKVYDRAQTMNFNKRAPKIHSFSEPLEQKFASYDMFMSLFEEAKSSMTFDAEENLTVQKVEKILAPYNISFGNRILKQMEDFVKIYCACFGDKNAVIKEAVEKILLSKVVSKLENKVVENKEALAAEFDRLGLAACADFVRKLNED